MVQHEGAETADAPLLHRHQHIVRAGQLFDELGIDRLGEARIGHRHGDAARSEVVGGAQAIGQPCAEG